MKKRGFIFEKLLVFLVVILILISILGFYFLNAKEKKAEKNYVEFKYAVLSKDVTVKSIKVPAVDRDGQGVITTIVVEAMPGIGRTLVDINNLLFWSDTQESIRKAREVASNYTGLNLDNYDLIYHIYANASVVGGPSAGAALTVVTIAALLDKDLRQDVMITGSINYDGTIGPVGDIYRKALAAKSNNATIFLVPLTQSKETLFEERKVCRKYGSLEYCSVEQVPKVVDIGSKVGLNVYEVKDINEVMRYFLI